MAGLALILLVALARAGETPAYRAARAVHLGYPAPEATAFYLEMSVEESTPGSYFMACGWNTGYFDIQELANRKKVILFSVWDPTAGDDPDAVKPEDHVEVLHTGAEARIRRFGGEGTGGPCMADFDWQPGQTNRFLVIASLQNNKTAYAGWLWLPDRGEWKHLVTFRTRTGGRALTGLYSFVEDFRREDRSMPRAFFQRVDSDHRRTVESPDSGPLYRVQCGMGIPGQHGCRPGGHSVLSGDRGRHQAGSRVGELAGITGGFRRAARGFAAVVNPANPR